MDGSSIIAVLCLFGFAIRSFGVGLWVRMFITVDDDGMAFLHGIHIGAAECY